VKIAPHPHIKGPALAGNDVRVAEPRNHRHYLSPSE
jgi:hypothetical protein